VGLTGHLYGFWEEKITCPDWGSNLGRPTPGMSQYINYIKKDNKLFEGKMCTNNDLEGPTKEAVLPFLL